MDSVSRNAEKKKEFLKVPVGCQLCVTPRSPLRALEMPVGFINQLKLSKHSLHCKENPLKASLLAQAFGLV